MNYQELSKEYKYKPTLVNQFNEYINKNTLPKTIDGLNVSTVERIDRINQLCIQGGEFDDVMNVAMQNYCDCIQDMQCGKMSKRSKNNFFYLSSKKWLCLDRAADYVLFNPDNDNFKYCYSARSLSRRYYSKGRKVNQINIGSLKHKDNESSESDDDFTDIAKDEFSSYCNGYSNYNPQFNLNEFMANLVDPLERKIVKLLYMGYSKFEIEKGLQYTQSELRTKIRQIEKNLYTKPKQKSAETKPCSRCGKLKSIDDFGKDGRNKDGLQTICRECDKIRKQNKKVTGIITKVAC